MNERSAIFDTFSLERRYGHPSHRVFAAWSDPDAKARWFAGPDAEHELDFRVGGREVSRGRHRDGPALRFESHYHDIVPNERLVYSSTLWEGDELATVSLTTVRFDRSEDGGTVLLLTQQGTYLDGREEPAWREQGTGAQLDALGAELHAAGHREGA